MDIEALVAGGGDPFVDSHNLMRCARVAPRGLAALCIQLHVGRGPWCPSACDACKMGLYTCIVPSSPPQHSNNVGEGAADAHLEDQPSRQAAQLCSGGSMRRLLLLMFNAAPGCRSVVVMRIS